MSKSKFDGENFIEEDYITLYYDKYGKETKNEKIAVACRVEYFDDYKFFIKRDKYNNVFDPLDLYYNEGDEAKVDVRYGGSVFNFVAVDEEVYNLYMKYLRDRRSHVFSEVKRRLM